MKFKIMSKVYTVYIWFISIFILSLLVLGSFLRYSLGYDLSLLAMLSIATPFLLAFFILLYLSFAKGPIKILLYVFGSLLVVGGVKTIVHQYLMPASGPLAMILIEYLVGVTLLIFGLCVVVPAHKLVKVERNI